MTFIKFVLLFMKQHFTELRRKWISLPLLLLYPLFIIALIATIFIFIFTPSENDPINIGLIDQDQSQETQMVIELIETTSQFGDSINIVPMNETEANNEIKTNQLSSYIIFPEGFTNDLYSGTPVDLNIIGNPEQPVKSQLVKELIESLTRHISASQANILTINYYAKELGINQSARSDLLFEQFKEFLLYTLSKDNILNEKEIDNIVTATPLDYYSLASWFIINTAWLLLLYSFFHQEETARMRHRIMLYGLTRLQQITAKIVLSVIVGCILMSLSLVGLDNIINTSFVWQDYMKIISIMFLYSITFLLSIALIESLVLSQKLSIALQITLTIGLFLFSGAIIPTLYLPIPIENIANYLFSFQAFNWLKDTFFYGQILVDYIPLSLSALAILCALIGVSLWKERK